MNKRRRFKAKRRRLARKRADDFRAMASQDVSSRMIHTRTLESGYRVRLHYEGDIVKAPRLGYLIRNSVA